MIYGHKRRAVVPLLCGLVRAPFPYFFGNTIALVVIGIALIVTACFALF